MLTQRGGRGGGAGRPPRAERTTPMLPVSVLGCATILVAGAEM